MKERSLYPKFQKKIKQVYPDCFCYKIPDTGKLGGKKPFDFVLVIHSIPFAIEFKKDEKQTATKYQDYQMELFKKSGGHSFVFYNVNSAVDMIKYEVSLHIERG